MPHRQKGSPYWYISYTDVDGKRLKVTSGTTVKAEADALEAKHRLAVHEQKKWGTSKQHTFDELLGRYFDDNQDKKSHSRDLTSAVPLTAYFTGRVVNELRGEDIVGYRTQRAATIQGNGRPISAATIAKELYLFSAAIRYAQVQLEWDVNNPVKGRAPKIRTKAPRWLRQDEIAAFVEAAVGIAANRFRTSPLVVDYALLMIATGMRPGEALGLSWDRVDLPRAMVYFDDDDQKSGVPGSIPLNSTAVDILKARRAYCDKHCPRTAWVFCHSTGERILSLKKAIETAARRAKLQRVVPHTFRHTFGAQMTQAGVDIRELKDLMRHADIRTTMIYAHLARESGRKLISRMDAVLKGVRPAGAFSQDLDIDQG